MLYSFFIYQSSTGLMLWKKTFEKRMNSHQIELFSSFFSAIQSFVKEMLTGLTEEGLKNMEMGNFLVNISHINQLDVDLVIIADKEDLPKISKIVPQLVNILMNHKELFKNWDGKRDRFDVLNFEILVMLSEEGKGLFDTKEDESFAEEIEELTKEQYNKYSEELKFLEQKFMRTINLYDKLSILDNLKYVAQKLNRQDKVKWIDRQRQKINEEIENTKFRLVYFVQNAKESLNKILMNMGGKTLEDLDYRDVYVSLYSFSSKLKLLGKDNLSKIYREKALTLIDESRPPEIRDIVKEILKMPETADYYINQE